MKPVKISQLKEAREIRRRNRGDEFKSTLYVCMEISK
jgi:hypothetical protein